MFKNISKKCLKIFQKNDSNISIFFLNISKKLKNISKKIKNILNSLQKM